MTFYAQYDPSVPAPSPVQGWYDTEFANYPNLPPTTNLLEMTEAQWAAHMTGRWAVSGGALVAYTPPAPVLTFAQEASAALNAGLTITATGQTLILAATAFPTDPTTTGKIGAVITTINTTSAFPGGATSYPMKDSAGAWHTFTVDEYKAVAAEIAGYAAALDLIADGNPMDATTLPASSVTLTV